MVDSRSVRHAVRKYTVTAPAHLYATHVVVYTALFSETVPMESTVSQFSLFVTPLLLLLLLLLLLPQSSLGIPVQVDDNSTHWTDHLMRRVSLNGESRNEDVIRLSAIDAQQFERLFRWFSDL